MKRHIAVLALALAACRRDSAPDAYGNFEATETVVSAQTSGQVLRFTPVEGARLDAGAVVATVDTVPLALELRQLEAQRGAGGARTTEAGQQVAALAAQREIALRTLERTRRLHADSAATAQQLDQAERDFRVLDAQLRAGQAHRTGAGEELQATDARIAQLRDRLARSRVANPVGGTVLATYVREGEFVQAGQPLYRIANLDTLELRAYVTEPQLAQVRLGARVDVQVDRAGEERLVVAGTVSWVSARAEFTPTPIQTRDERADLVYAIKVRVPNRDGALKIGMPADLSLASQVATGTGR